MSDYNVYYCDFPPKVKEAVTVNEDGSFSIFLNSALTFEQNQKSFLHALKHIENDDFYKEDADVDQIERIAHGNCN